MNDEEKEIEVKGLIHKNVRYKNHKETKRDNNYNSTFKLTNNYNTSILGMH